MITKDNGFDLNIRWRFPSGRRYAFTFAVLFISLIIIYGNTFHGSWHFDDHVNIVENRNIELKSLSLNEMQKSFYGVDFSHEKISRPLSYLSFALNYYISGTNTFGYHVVNFAIHYLAAVFLFLLIYNTLRLPFLNERYGNIAYAVALLSAFLWATHPIQITAVTYIVQRMASMAALFYIMAMYLYLKARTTHGNKQRIVFVALCCVTAILSFASKENAAMLPLSIFLYDLFLIQGLTHENIKKNLKIALVPVIVILLVTLFYVDLPSILEGYKNRPFTLTERLLTEPRVILFYISLLLYPVTYRFALLHDFGVSASLLTPWATVPAILTITIIIGLALWRSRKNPLISFCVLFFFLNHIIEGSFIPLEIIYEHRNYLPSTLLFVLFSIFIINVINYFSYKKSVQFLMVSGIIILMVFQGHTTYSYNKLFRSEYIRLLDNISKAPNLSRPHNNLGRWYWDKNIYSKAFEESNEALRLDNYSNLRLPAITHENIGIYYLRTGSYDKAMAHFLESVRISSGNTHPRTYFGIAMTNYRMGNLNEAQKYIEDAIAILPESEEYRAILSMILLKSGDIDGAILAAGKALELKADYNIPLVMLAESFRKKGDNKKAVRYWEAFLKENPRYIKGHFALAEALSVTGNKKMLSKIIGRLMYLKGEKSYTEIIQEANGKDDITPYICDPDILLPIIRKSLTDQAKDVSMEARSLTGSK
ncbi:MAG: tetratricopeptide repeat protein [Deltaproteobacteria bacterium]|nr:tetratricopeptide repeat protein [Deltaproteobacteria bacterium]